MEKQGTHLKLRRLTLAAAGCVLAALPILGMQASSHREAPAITQMPKVDGTDLYMFMSYEPNREGFVTLIANYVPFQDPWAGPNYYMLDPDARYQIHVDNNGDAVQDVTFEFRFENRIQDQTLTVGDQQVSISLINSGQISADSTDTLHVIETYGLDVYRGGQAQAVTNAETGEDRFIKPVDNIGQKTLPDYADYAAAHIHDVSIPGCGSAGRVFVGQRKDPFVVNVGEAFDLINLEPLGPDDGQGNALEGKNITSFVLEVPADCLATGDDPVIGGWTTASVAQTRTLRPDQATENQGPQVQVSRLGNPLVNELVIGLPDKDSFNGSEPSADAQFLTYVTNPTFPELVELLFPDARAPNNLPRNDLVAVFLTGIPGVNQPASVTPSEMMRLNTSVPPTPRESQNNLGVLAGDTAGFPNGRRPGDDVVDTELRVLMGVLCTLNQPDVFGCVPDDAPAGTAAFTDGASVSAADFDEAFPYLRTPIPGSPNEVNNVLGLAGEDDE